MFVVLLFLSAAPLAKSGTSVTISDRGISDKDVTPALGRGYSIATGTILATCLDVGRVSESSFDYDYQYLEISSQTNTESELKTKFGVTAGVSFAGASIANNNAIKSKTEKIVQNIIARMLIDRYYNSVDEGSSTMNIHAKEILLKRDFVGFFQACGPTFFRSIRRSSELVLHFHYESDSDTSSTRFGIDAKAQLGAMGVGFFADSTTEKKTENFAFESTLIVHIKAFGMGNNLVSSGALIASKFEDAKGVLDTAYEAMVQPGSPGYVTSVEVVPWIKNVDFQLAMGANEKIELTACQDINGNNISCATGPLLIVHKRSRVLPAMLKQFNVLQNAEHVAKLDLILRKKMNFISTLEHCIGMLSQYSSHDLERYYVLDQNTGATTYYVESSATEDINSKDFQILRASRLLYLLSGQEGGQYLIERLIANVLAFIDHYFGPCTQEMGRDNKGVPGGKLMTTHWMNMDQCNDIGCTFPNSNIVTTNGITTCEMSTTIGSMSSEILVEKYCMPILWNFKPTNPYQTSIKEIMPKHLGADSVKLADDDRFD